MGQRENTRRPLAEIDRGALFRAKLNSHSEKLGTRKMSEVALYRLVRSYLERLPQAMAHAQPFFLCTALSVVCRSGTTVLTNKRKNTFQNLQAASGLAVLP